MFVNLYLFDKILNIFTYKEISFWHYIRFGLFIDTQYAVGRVD